MKLKTKIDFISNPVVSGNFDPVFYWKGDLHTDARLINKPHIEKEGDNENRTLETYFLLKELENHTFFTVHDMFNIQNALLKKNNWKGIKSGYRKHEVNLSEIDFKLIPELMNHLFPIGIMKRYQLLEWYRQIMLIHPLSDLNGRTFGIIVASLYNKYENFKK